MITIDGPVYLDANVLIYAMETDGEEGMLARRWLMQVDQGKIIGVTSELTIVEVLPQPIAKSNGRLLDGYRRLFTSIPTLTMVPVSSAILFRAAELRAELKSETPDAIHIATALDAGCNGFLTNDDRMRLPAEMRPLRLAGVMPLYR